MIMNGEDYTSAILQAYVITITPFPCLFLAKAYPCLSILVMS